MSTCVGKSDAADNSKRPSSIHKHYGPRAKKLAIAANRGEPEAKARLETLLDKNGLDKGSIVSDAIIRRLVEFERLERLISSAEKRRDDILKSIDPRRQNLAQCLTKNIDDIVEDVEVERKEISVSPLS